MSNPPINSTVIYAMNTARVAEFYKTTLLLRVIEEQKGFVVLGNFDSEINVVQFRQHDADASRD